METAAEDFTNPYSPSAADFLAVLGKVRAKGVDQ
jgi:hypothetical protein